MSDFENEFVWNACSYRDECLSARKRIAELESPEYVGYMRQTNINRVRVLVLELREARGRIAELEAERGVVNKPNPIPEPR